MSNMFLKKAKGTLPDTKAKQRHSKKRKLQTNIYYIDVKILHKTLATEWNIIH